MKIILFANTDWYLYNFSLPLARTLRNKGHEVILLSPAGRYSPLLEQDGFNWQQFSLTRKGANPFQELDAFVRLVKVFRKYKPDIVHHYTIKPVIYGSVAARLSGIRRVINEITGLGHIFTSKKVSAWALRKLVTGLYFLGLEGTTILFQNTTDRDLFLQLKLIKPEQAHLIPGAGVDIEIFTQQPQPEGTPLIVFPGRLLKAKGVEDFIAAARLVKQTNKAVRFALVGQVDLGNPDSVSEQELEIWQTEGIVEYWGWQDDMIKVYAQTSIICFPSAYREGLSRVLLEAAACGRPIITTDWPGCREAVEDGESGLLVPVHEPQLLARALENLLMKPAEWQSMGTRGRQIIEQKFSLERVLKETLAIYEL
jgi:glycosyltransferase involved in cell wall biosynthesis